MNKNWYNDTHTLNLVISILEDRKELLEENRQLHNKMDKAIETIESWYFALDWSENDRLKIIKEILKDGDVDE